MELRHLRYFAAAAGQLSFTRAAASLRVAQPSLSVQIRNLEEEVGTRLIDRDRNHVALTDAGAVFLQDAKQILADVGRAVERAREAAAGKLGSLHIGAVATLTFPFLPAALARFRATCPHVDISTTECPAADLAPRLMSGDLHLGFVASPFEKQLPRENFARRKILRSPLVVILGPDHPLANARRVSLRDFARDRFLPIAVPGFEGFRQWIEAMCHKAGFAPRFGLGANSPESLASMVAAGKGVSLTAKLYERPPSAGYIFKPVSDPGLEFEYFAVWKARNPSAALNNFLNLLGNVAENESLMSRERKRTKHGGLKTSLPGTRR